MFAKCLELGIPIPTIDAAVWSRSISSFKDERMHASTILTGPVALPVPGCPPPGNCRSRTRSSRSSSRADTTFSPERAGSGRTGPAHTA